MTIEKERTFRPQLWNFVKNGTSTLTKPMHGFAWTSEAEFLIKLDYVFMAKQVQSTNANEPVYMVAYVYDYANGVICSLEVDLGGYSPYKIYIRSIHGSTVMGYYNPSYTFGNFYFVRLKMSGSYSGTAWSVKTGIYVSNDPYFNSVLGGNDWYSVVSMNNSHLNYYDFNFQELHARLNTGQKCNGMTGPFHVYVKMANSGVYDSSAVDTVNPMYFEQDYATQEGYTGELLGSGYSFAAYTGNQLIAMDYKWEFNKMQAETIYLKAQNVALAAQNDALSTQITNLKGSASKDLTDVDNSIGGLVTNFLNNATFGLSPLKTVASDSKNVLIDATYGLSALKAYLSSPTGGLPLLTPFFTSGSDFLTTMNTLKLIFVDKDQSVLDAFMQAVGDRFYAVFMSKLANDPFIEKLILLMTTFSSKIEVTTY